MFQAALTPASSHKASKLVLEIASDNKYIVHERYSFSNFYFYIISNSQKNCKNNTMNFVIPFYYIINY